jgi:2-iminobutanoate/2-iminopropanoate deaminase
MHALHPIQPRGQGGVTEVIATTGAPGAIGPYSQAIRAGDYLFVSGQVAIDPATGAFVSGSTGDQTHQVLKNLGAILQAAGASYDRVVKTTVYLADMADFAAMNEAYASYFPPPAPARATIQAGRLPRDARVEIDLIAYLK